MSILQGPTILDSLGGPPPAGGRARKIGCSPCVRVLTIWLGEPPTGIEDFKTVGSIVANSSENVKPGVQVP